MAYDPGADVAHIQLAYAPVAQSVEIAPGIVHELDRAGRLLGIKVHAAKNKLVDTALANN